MHHSTKCVSDAAHPQVVIATAGWSIPKQAAARFPAEGTHLVRYAQVLNGVEINSSFYRSHARATYARWAASVPDSFRFAVKMPRTITHERALRSCEPLLEQFLEEIAGLGSKCGPILVQLPPSFEFDRHVVGRFLTLLRARYRGLVACEPRHESWFSASAAQLLEAHAVSGVAADPPRARADGSPWAWPGLHYYRLHGTPRIYWSRYATDYLQEMTARLSMASSGTNQWVVFDNTAAGAATENALELLMIVADSVRKRRAR